MKIGIIHSIYKPHSRGGAEVVVQSIVSGLKKRGHNIFVLSVGKDNKIDNIDGEKIYRVDPPNIFNFLDINSQPVWKRMIWHILDMFNIFSAVRVYKIFKNEKPDFVFCQGVKGIGYLTLPVLRILNIRVIQRIYDMQPLHPSGLLKKNPLPIYFWLCKKLFGSPEVVIFPSQYIKGVYEKYGFFLKSKKVVLGNPIKNILPLPEEGIEHAGVETGHAIVETGHAIVETGHAPSVRDNGKFNILFLGQVEEYKGILDLICVIKKITPSQSPPCKGGEGLVLHIVGDGKALDKAKKLTGDDKRIIFHGRMSHEELEREIWFASPKPGGEGGSNIDLLVNPSQVPESFGMVLIEANSKGIPVLATEVGALPELIEEGKNGWLTPSDDVEKLKEKIEEIIKNKEKLAGMKKTCVELVKKYNVEDYVEKILSL